MENSTRLNPMAMFPPFRRFAVLQPAAADHAIGSNLLNRTSLFIFALLGLLPYVSTIKLPPSPSFWAEWLAAVLASCWLLTLPGRTRFDAAGSPTVWVVMPVATWGCIALGACMLGQLVTGQPMFRGAAVLTIGAMVLAALMCLAGARIRRAGEAVRLFDVLAVSLLIAVLVNALVVVVEWQGIHVYGYRLGFRESLQRAEGLIGQPNQLAVFGALGGAAANYLWMRGRIRSYIHLLFSFVITLLIAACASKTGVVAWCIGALSCWITLRGNSRQATGRSLVVAGALLLVAAQVAVPHLAPTESGAVAAARGETQGRYELWRDSVELIRRHPLTGVGYGNFAGARWSELDGSIKEPNATHAHNLVFELAAELGVPAMLLIIIPLTLGLYRCAKVALRPGSPPEQYLAAAMALLIATHALLEYPLWYMFFLIPFSLALGLVDQPDYRLKVSALPKSLRWTGWGAAMAFCILVAVDYRRSEVLYTDVTLQQEGTTGSNGSVLVPIAAATSVNALTFFDVFANMMYSRTLQPDGFYMGYKLDIADRAMLTMTNHETIGRRIALLVSAGKNDEALALLAKTRRSNDLEKLTRGVLASMTRTSPKLAQFIAELPPLPASSAGH